MRMIVDSNYLQNEKLRSYLAHDDRATGYTIWCDDWGCVYAFDGPIGSQQGEACVDALSLMAT